MLRLLIEDSEGKSKQAQITPESGEITIGRKAGNVIRLKERNVSREHARIYQNDEGLFVEPVAARYGMKVNGKKIDGATHIELGDEIKIGDYRLYVQDESKPAMTPAEQAAEAAAKGEACPLPVDQQPRLVVISSNFAGHEHPIIKTICKIGRNADNDICLNHTSVSGTHAEIRRNARGLFEIINKSSSNGTKVNGKDIGAQPYELSSGEFISFGLVVTRFCAPGELWYFNIGSAPEPKSNKILLVALVIAIVAAAVLGTIMFMQNTNNNANGQASDSNTKQNEEDMNKMKSMSLFMQCQAQTTSGEFDQAEQSCNEARKLDSTNSNIDSQLEKIRKERNAASDLDTILNDISAGGAHCREALNMIKDQTVDPNTYAGRSLQTNRAEERAKECLADYMYGKAMDALDANDIKSAESELAEMKSTGLTKTDSYDKLAAAIAEKKNANRPAAPSRTGSSSHSSKPAPEAPVAAPAPSDSGMSLDDLCALAVKAKMKKDYVKVCEYGKKAQKKGGDSACNNKVKEYVGNCK